MIRYVLTILAVVSVVVVSGCATVHQGIHMARQTDIKEGRYNIQVYRFAAGEMPTVVVTGCGGHNVTVRIINLSTGNAVKNCKDYVPESWTKWWWFNDLAKGEYEAVLVIEGATKASVKFKVD